MKWGASYVPTQTRYTLTVTALTHDDVIVTGQTVTVRQDSANGLIYATAAYEGQPVSFSMPTGFSYYVSITDNLAYHFKPEVQSGMITNTDVNVILYYGDFSTIQTAPDIKNALNAGMDLTDLVGEQITCSKGNDTLTWDVVDYRNNTVTLLLHDIFLQLPFDRPQATMRCENGLVAGNYYFTDSNSTFYFTLSQAIPPDGWLIIKSEIGEYGYAFDSNGSQIFRIDPPNAGIPPRGSNSLGKLGVGSLNNSFRVEKGSNNFAESAIFAWLNSNTTKPFAGTTKFSIPQDSFQMEGFLSGLDQNFVNCLDNTIWKCNTNSVYECPVSLGGSYSTSTQYTVTAKVGLPSEKEIFGTCNGIDDGSELYQLFQNATEDDRKKYYNNVARSWWLRSPSWGGTYNVRYVTTSSSVNYFSASKSLGVVPAVKISKDVIAE